jgi:hypothetical protein
MLYTFWNSNILAIESRDKFLNNFLDRAQSPSKVGTPQNWNVQIKQFTIMAHFVSQIKSLRVKMCVFALGSL